jgi:hypothetical protein
VRYPTGRKEAILQKIAPPMNISIPELAEQEDISAATPKISESWSDHEDRFCYHDPLSYQWTSQEKFRINLDRTLNEADFEAYYRECGFYPCYAKEGCPGFIHNGPHARLLAICADSDLLLPFGWLITGGMATAIYVYLIRGSKTVSNGSTISWMSGRYTACAASGAASLPAPLATPRCGTSRGGGSLASQVTPWSAP